MSLAYLNGEYLPVEQCRIPALDRGFIFGDAIYELIPVYFAQPFQLQAHLARLRRSLEQVSITNPHSDYDWQQLISVLIENANLDQCSIYIQVTRGVAPRDHAYPAAATPTVFAMVNPWPKLDEKMLTQGLSAMTVEDMRWNRCDIKVTSLLANVMMKQQAIEAHAHEAIFVRDNTVLEGSSTNVFVVRDKQVYTAPKNNLVLPGITRDVVVNLVRSCDMSMHEEAVSMEDLTTADEVWLTSSTKECLPVTHLNQYQVGNGEPGHMWRAVYDSFQALKSQ